MLFSRSRRRLLSVLLATEAKRAAVVLRGMSFADGRGRGPIDWRVSQESLVENYIGPRLEENYTVDVYYHTYRSRITTALAEAYKPKRRRITGTFSRKNKYASHQTSLVLALETVENPKSYDEVLVARFDLLYLQPVTEWRLDPEAFNVPWKDIDPRKHCDVIWVFPGNAVDDIIHDIKAILHHPPHRQCCGGELHFYAPKHLPLKFMFDGAYSSDTDFPEKFAYNVNPLYKLHRYRSTVVASSH